MILLKKENSTSYAKCDEGVYEAFFSIQNVDLNRTWNYFIGLGMGIMIISCFLMWAVITYMKPQFCKKRKVYDPKEVTSPNSDFEQSVENPSFDVFSLKTVEDVDDSIFVDNDLYASTESLPAFDNTEKIDKTPNLTEWTNEEDLEQNKGFCQKPNNLLSNQREDYIKEIKQVIQTKNPNAKSMSRGTSYGSDEYDVVDITDVEEVEDVYDNLEEITANPSCSDSQPEVKMNPTPNIQNSLNQNLGLTTNESIFVENEIYGDFEEIRSKDDSKVKRMKGQINRNKTFDNQSIRNDVSKKEIIPSCEFQITKEQKKNSILQKFKKIVLKSKKHDKVRNISIGDSIGDCSNYDMIELKEDVKKIMNNPIYNDPEVIRKSQIRFSSSTNKKPMGPEPQTDKFKAGEEEFFDNSIYDDPEYLIEEIEDLPTDFRGNVLSTKHANISLMNNKLETKHHGEMPAKSLDQYKLGKEISTLDYETIDFKDHDQLRKLENSSSTFKESGSGDDDKKDREEEESDVFVNNCLYEDTKEMVLDKNRYSIPCVTTSPEYEDNYSDMVKEGSLYNSLVGDQEESLYYSLVGDQAGDIILENQERNLILGEKDHVVPGQFLSPKKRASIQDDYTSITDEAGEEYFDNPIYQVRNSYLDSHNIDFTDSKKFKPPSEEEKSNPDEVMDNMLYEGTEDVLPERQLNHKEEENVDSKSSLRLYQISPMDKELIPSYEKKVEPFAYVPDNVTLKEQKNPADDEKDYPYASTSNSQKCLSLFPNRLESSFEKGSTDHLFYKKPGEMMQNSNKHSLDFEIMDDVYANPLIIQRNSSSTSEKSVGDRHHQEEEGGEEIEGGGGEGEGEKEGEEEIEEERREGGEEGEEEREEERKECGEEREEGGGEEIEEERKEEEREEEGVGEGEGEEEEREEGGGEEREEESGGGGEEEEEGEEIGGGEEKENGERVVVEEENQQKGKQERETEEKEEEKSKEEKVEKEEEEEEEEEEKKIREGDIEKEDKDLEEKKVEEEGKEEREQAENNKEEER